jgi:hypothetical protein
MYGESKPIRVLKGSEIMILLESSCWVVAPGTYIHVVRKAPLLTSPGIPLILNFGQPAIRDNVALVSHCNRRSCGSKRKGSDEEMESQQLHADVSSDERADILL